MIRAWPAEIDRVGLEGTGTAPQPRGIKNTTRRLTVTTVGTLADYSKLITGIGQLLTNNGDLAQVTKFAVMSATQWAELENLPTGLTGYARVDFLVERPASLCTLEGIT